MPLSDGDVVAEEKERDVKGVGQSRDIMIESRSGHHDDASCAPVEQSLSKEENNAPATLEGHSDTCPSGRTHLEESGACQKLDTVQLSGTKSSESSEPVERASAEVLATGWGAPPAMEFQGAQTWHGAGQADKAHRLIKQLQVGFGQLSRYPFFRNFSKRH
jgi:hypothetical protein